MKAKEFVKSLNKSQKKYLISLLVYETLTGECEDSSILIKELGIDLSSLLDIASSGSLNDINEFLKKYGIKRSFPND